MKITVAGTGYAGLSQAVLLSQHHEVTALDVIPEKEFFGNRVITDFDAFKSMCSVIVANRFSSELEEVKDKIYTRGLYFRD